MGCLISREHRDNVHAFVERAVAAGATILTGGVMPAADAPGAYYPPTVLEGADVSSEIFQEEVFRPVTILVPFTDEASAIKLANATRFGLSGSVWTRDISKALRVARAVESGVLSINCSNSVHTELPFGGFKESGIGRDLGKSALDAYTEVKTVFVRTI
jgi:betaine-aldehyde dehydrogenase